MVLDHVIPQTPPLSEALPTFDARVRLLFAMHLHVHPQIVLRVKRPTAHFALKRPHLIVDPHVRLLVRRESEPLFAHRTLVRLNRIVFLPVVHVQIFLATKGGAAFATNKIASVRMQRLVRFHRAVLIEAFAANLTRVWPFAGVYPSVGFQSSRDIKRGTAYVTHVVLFIRMRQHVHS